MIAFVLDTDTLTLLEEGHPVVAGHFLRHRLTLSPLRCCPRKNSCPDGTPL